MMFCVMFKSNRLNKVHVISLQQQVGCVATLILGLRPRQRLAKVWAKSEFQESHFMLLGMWESVKE